MMLQVRSNLALRFAAVFALLLASGMSFAADDATSVELGHRIYTDGVLPSGEPMTGLVSGDVEIAGDFVEASGEYEAVVVVETHVVPVGIQVGRSGLGDAAIGVGRRRAGDQRSAVTTDWTWLRMYDVRACSA